MYRHVGRSGFYICSATILPSSMKKTLDGTEESGWDRVVNVFKKDEYDNFSPELSKIYETTIFTGFVGACYGGFIHSRDAYLNFIERNEASKYADHFEAKRKLQDHVTLSFFKGAYRWSWRLALFGGLYTSYVSLAAAYRGEVSIFDYVLGGCISGFIYRLNYGLNGVIVGATLGSFVGLLAGSLTTMVLRFTGKSYDDISEWHNQQLLARQRHLKEAFEKSVQDEGKRNLLSEHDKRMNAS